MAIKPILELEKYPQGFTEILHKFEDGKSLSADQLHFISSHEKYLSNSILDPVLRYYLTEHKLRPHKALPLELPKKKFTDKDFQQLKYNIHVLLKNNLSEVDLSLTPEQFLEFKAAGLHELVFWHSNQFLPGSIFYHGAFPYRLYFQWGRLFGVIKFHFLSCGKTVEGKVLIYIENRNERRLEECIREYARKLKEQKQPENKLIHTPEAGLVKHYNPQTPSEKGL